MMGNQLAAKSSVAPTVHCYDGGKILSRFFVFHQSFQVSLFFCLKKKM